MAGIQHTLGRCELCGKEFAKAGMSKHLTACAPKFFAENPSGTQERLVFVICVSGADAPDYWMHLAVSGDAKLIHLDDFLREIWLECCGHLSHFIIGDDYFLILSDAEKTCSCLWSTPRASACAAILATSIGGGGEVQEGLEP